MLDPESTKKQERTKTEVERVHTGQASLFPLACPVCKAGQNAYGASECINLRLTILRFGFPFL